MPPPGIVFHPCATMTMTIVFFQYGLGDIIEIDKVGHGTIDRSDVGGTFDGVGVELEFRSVRGGVNGESRLGVGG